MIVIDDLDMELMLDLSFWLLGWKIVTEYENWWTQMVREKKKCLMHWPRLEACFSEFNFLSDAIINLGYNVTNDVNLSCTKKNQA